MPAENPQSAGMSPGHSSATSSPAQISLKDAQNPNVPSAIAWIRFLPQRPPTPPQTPRCDKISMQLSCTARHHRNTIEHPNQSALLTLEKPAELCVCGRATIDFPARTNLLTEIYETKAREIKATRDLISVLQERVWVLQALDRAHERVKNIVEETGGPASPFHDEYWAKPQRPVSIYDRPWRTLRRTSAAEMNWAARKPSYGI